ncbi:hypothetical protein ACHAXA_004942 [Cyclostephanos tholiformis]|uniref:Uncharacterized protein n=1 Tax=Cyclostephanos tholiformis TaxID=382380 RepID=A0ABD3RS06_9STRA
MGDNSFDDEDPVASFIPSDSDAIAPPPPIPPPANALATRQVEEEVRAGVPSSSGAVANNVENSGNDDASARDLNEELDDLLRKGHLPQKSVDALRNLIRENSNLAEKNSKLKSLLGRSAKAQRDAKNELESMRRSYDAAKVECERLERRVEALASRPTHMDLLADFETNFDRALLSIGTATGGAGGRSVGHYQSGGEDAFESSIHASSMYDDASVIASSRLVGASSGGSARVGSDPLLLTELNESVSRIAHLESLNSSLQGRCANLERAHGELLQEQQSSRNALANMQLELRMSRMETEHATRCLREKEAIIAEMQLEIDLVTKSAVDANRRAAEGMEAAQGARSDREYVAGLEAKVVALQEWALASTESKRLTSERCRGLEGRVRELEGAIRKIHASGGGMGVAAQCVDGTSMSSDLGDTSMPLLADVVGRKIIPYPSSGSVAGSSQGGDDQERKLWTRSSSLVVGAGMVGHAPLELGKVHIEPYETVILRWKFDLTPGDLDIYFSILKGVCEDKKSQRAADACFRHRHVTGGGGGDVSGAFAKQNACTLLWSNEMSWVRPRTIKWTVDAVAIEWSD